MKKIISGAVCLLLFSLSSLAQSGTTVLPHTTVLPSTTVFPGTSPGIQVVNCNNSTRTNCGTGQASSATLTSVATGSGSGTAFACSAGQAAFMGFAVNASGVSATASDSASNSGWGTYNATPYQSQTSYYLTWFVNYNLTSSITSATVSFTSGNYNAAVIALCVSGLSGKAGDFTQSNSSTVSSTATFTSGSFTTAHANEIVITFGDNSANLLTSATGPAVLGPNYNASSLFFFFNSIYTIYASTQSSQTQAGTLAGSSSYDNITMGAY